MVYGVRCGVEWHSVMYYVVWCGVLFCSFVEWYRGVLVVCFCGDVLGSCGILSCTYCVLRLYPRWYVGI